jgi:capsular polysaccharide transport system permease protein
MALFLLNNMKNTSSSFQRNFFVQTLRVFAALMVREMITRYGRSWGGYIWAIIEPMSVILMLTLLFAQILDRPIYGDSFLVFFATGYLPFYFFMNISGQVSGGIAVNRELLQLPMVKPIDVLFARFVLGYLTLLIVSAIIFYVAALTIRHGISFDPVSLLAGFTSAALLGLGVGCLNAFIFAILPVWRQVWGVLSAPLLIISGVFYPLDSLPVQIQNILVWNPVVHAIGRTRAAFYPSYRDDYVDLPYVLVIALATFLLALYFLLRHRTILIESK